MSEPKALKHFFGAQTFLTQTTILQDRERGLVLTLKFIGALRHISGKTQLTVNYEEAMSLKKLLEKLRQDMPQLEKSFSDQTADSTSNALILVNGREISVLNGYETELNDGDEIVFVPVVHGG